MLKGDLTCATCHNCYSQLRKYRCFADEKRRMVDEYIIRETYPDWCPLTQPTTGPKVEDMTSSD